MTEKNKFTIRYYCPNCGYIQKFQKGNLCSKCAFKAEEIEIANPYKLKIGFRILYTGFIFFGISFFLEFIRVFRNPYLFFISIVILIIGAIIINRANIEINSDVREKGYRQYGEPHKFILTSKMNQINSKQNQLKFKPNQRQIDQGKEANGNNYMEFKEEKNISEDEELRLDKIKNKITKWKNEGYIVDELDLMVEEAKQQGNKENTLNEKNLIPIKPKRGKAKIVILIIVIIVILLAAITCYYISGMIGGNHTIHPEIAYSYSNYDYNLIISNIYYLDKDNHIIGNINFTYGDGTAVGANLVFREGAIVYYVSNSLYLTQSSTNLASVAIKKGDIIHFPHSLGTYEMLWVPSGNYNFGSIYFP